jgi:predicted nucleotidyltransferase
MKLKELRNEYNLTQLEAAKILGIPERTYRRYETDDNYGSLIKRKMFINMLNEHCEITEEKGLLSVQLIKEKVSALFDNEYDGQIDFCYLFGSYARGEATIESDVDIVIVENEVMGLKFYGLAAELEDKLGKEVDLHSHRELSDNDEFLARILTDGVKIYGPNLNKIKN